MPSAADHLRVPRITLEQHSAPTLDDPPWADVEASLRGLHPRDRGHFILSRPGAGYVQAAGARLRMICEWRDLSPATGAFRHHVLGKPGRDVRRTSINTCVGTVKLQVNEVLTLEDVVSVFGTFCDTGSVPDGYVLRDDTARFKRLGG